MPTTCLTPSGARAGFHFSSTFVLTQLLVVMPMSAAEPYPNRPIRIVVPYAAGSGLDAVSRLIGNHLTSA